MDIETREEELAEERQEDMLQLMIADAFAKTILNMSHYPSILRCMIDKDERLYRLAQSSDEIDEHSTEIARSAKMILNSNVGTYVENYNNLRKRVENLPNGT